MKFKKLINSPVELIPAQKLIKHLLSLLIVLGFGGIGVRASENVEITGSYQSLVACHETHHVVFDLVETPGKDKFSNVHQIIEIPEALRPQLRVGMKLKIKGQHKPATTKRMTKAQVRQQMFKHITKRQGVPLSCAKMGEIISKIKTNKQPQPQKGQAKAPRGHDHGELKMVAVEDDDEIVEVLVPEHVVVTHIEIVKGGPVR